MLEVLDGTSGEWTEGLAGERLAPMSSHPGIEMRTEKLVLRLNDRVFEAFHLGSAHSLRLHVDSVGFGVRDPDRHGRVRVVIGRMDGGEISMGSERLKLDLDPIAWARFQEFVAQVKQVQAAGPEAW